MSPKTLIGASTRKTIGYSSSTRWHSSANAIICSLLNAKYPFPSYCAVHSRGLSKCDKNRLYNVSFCIEGWAEILPLAFFSSSNFYIGTWIVFPPGYYSISARSNLILLFILARLYIGGVPLRVVSLPSHCMLLAFGLVEFGECFLYLLAPIVSSSFETKAGTFWKSSKRSSFIIEFVGILGVSFSKPPCINTVASIAQTLWRNL